MEVISVLDMLKVGVGPSSSHTLGPWRAIQRWLRELEAQVGIAQLERVRIELFGSLALTGKGHCTDQAICLALQGHDPETIPVDRIGAWVEEVRREKSIVLPDGRRIAFDPQADIAFFGGEQLPLHPNGLRCIAWAHGRRLAVTFYSVGGGFVVKEGEEMRAADRAPPPYPCQNAADVLRHCGAQGFGIAQMVRADEETWLAPDVLQRRILRIWGVMKESIHKGCHTLGVLPGGLAMKRRAAEMNAALLGEAAYTDVDGWIAAIRAKQYKFQQVLKWVSCFALAVNEENAALGRVVTAPTNGSAGVIPAVLMYHVCFGEREVMEREIADFLLIAGEIGALFKKGATISAALGGCQAEIGVSSAMAAAALAEVSGGTVAQALMAAEVAMEHHLGMTCDPVRGLVQIPCIERNAMGAVKAINAAELALASDPAAAKVSLDDVIRTMQQTARDMSSRYKETSQGGLAVSVQVPEC